MPDYWRGDARLIVPADLGDRTTVDALCEALRGRSFLISCSWQPPALLSLLQFDRIARPALLCFARPTWHRAPFADCCRRTDTHVLRPVRLHIASSRLEPEEPSAVIQGIKPVLPRS